MHPQRRVASHARLIDREGGIFPQPVVDTVDNISRSGGTPLVVTDGKEVLGVIHLKDMVKGGIKERFIQLRKMGIRTVMITGDNKLTAAAIAAEAGVDDFLPRRSRRTNSPSSARNRRAGAWWP
jgi:K+-transporting ATPase ATPase B chain